MVIGNFVYMKDRFGQEYGWGVAEYSIHEKFVGDTFTIKVYRCEPEESYSRMIKRFQGLFPEAAVKMIRQFLK